MAWQPRADGLTYCTLCETEFRRPRSCACPHDATRAPGEVRLGSMESMTAQARELGMPDRLGVERLLLARIRRADAVASKYRLRSGTVLKRGAVRMGREGPVDADEEKVAQGWDALAEQARNRGDKAARHLYSAVIDRERRADLERQERLAEKVTGKSKAAPPPQPEAN